jgi:hypothetical protein
MKIVYVDTKTLIYLNLPKHSKHLNYLKIFWKFLSSLVSRIHGEENTEFEVHFHRVAISENESFPFLFLA